MIRNHKYGKLISNSILKIETNTKILYLAINYEKSIEKGIEIYFLVKIKEIEGFFKLYDTCLNNPICLLLKDSETRLNTINLPPFCEEVLITINYIGEEDSNSIIDIYPIGYKL